MEFIEIPEPQITKNDRMTIAGLASTYSFSDCSAIPAQWERFNHLRAQIPHPIDGATYGVCAAGDGPGTMKYYAGIGVTDTKGLPEEFETVTLPGARYACFRCDHHIAQIQRVIHTVWNQWLPESGYRPDDSPSFERYTQSYDPETGAGGFEIWVPIAS